MRPTTAVPRLQLLAAALIFSTGGAATQATSLTCRELGAAAFFDIERPGASERTIRSLIDRLVPGSSS